MKKILLLNLVCLTQLVWTQPDFQRLYQPAANSQAYANSVQLTADGGFIMAGRDSATTAQGYDAYLLKLAANGDTVWARSYGTAADEYGQYAIQSNDGGYMMAGIAIGVSVDVFLVKTNANGDTVWTRILGLPGDNEANFVQQTNDGNFIVAGYTSGAGAGGYDYFLLKIDNNGTVLWSKTYGTALDELAYTVFQTGDKGYILAGAAMRSTGDIDTYAVKTDSMGVEQWSKYYGTTETDWAYMMRPTSDGGYILTGYVGTSAGGLDALLLKTNSAGDTLWTGTYGSFSFEQGLGVIETNNGGYAVSGSVYFGSQGGSDAMLLRTDNVGHLLYCRGFGGGGDDWAQSVLQLNDHAFVLGAYSNTFNAGKYNFYLVRTDTLGNTVANCNEINTSVVQTQASITTTTLSSTVLPLTMSVSTGSIVVDSMKMQAEGCSSLGVQIVSKENFSFGVFPNPSGGVFCVKADRVQADQVRLVIEDMMGKQVYAESISNEKGSINNSIRLNDLTPGVYFVRLVAGTQSSSVKLIIVK